MNQGSQLAQITRDLPAGWIQATIGHVLGRIETGKSFRCDERPPSEGEIGVVKVSAVTWGTYDESESKTCTDPKRVDFSLLIKTGDFLFSRANTIELVGACVIAERVTKRIMLSDKILRFLINGIDQRWILWYLRAPQGRAAIQAFSSGNQMSMRNIGQERIRQISLPMAPKVESTRILDKIDEQLSELDAAVASLERAERNLVRYRAAVLAAACSGKLVETEAELANREGRRYEAADKLLERILTERRKSSAKVKYEEPAKPDIGNLPNLPSGWVWSTTDQIAEIRLGRQRSPDKVSKEYPTKYVRAANITERGLNLDNVLDMEFSPSEQEVYKLKNGDILVSEASGSPDQVGKSAIWRNQIPGCCFQNTVIRVRPYTVSIRYLHLMFSLHYYTGFFARMSAGVGINHLSAGKFASVPVALPPLAEQVRIVDEVDRHMSRAEVLGVSIIQAKRRTQRLRLAILAAAFQGRLVPQDPKDEPASVLLDRIRSQAIAEVSITSNRNRRSPERVMAAIAHSSSDTNSAPKRRGRPPGSKNKAK